MCLSRGSHVREPDRGDGLSLAWSDVEPATRAWRSINKWFNKPLGSRPKRRGRVPGGRQRQPRHRRDTCRQRPEQDRSDLPGCCRPGPGPDARVRLQPPDRLRRPVHRGAAAPGRRFWRLPAPVTGVPGVSMYETYSHFWASERGGPTWASRVLGARNRVQHSKRITLCTCIPDGPWLGASWWPWPPDCRLWPWIPAMAAARLRWASPVLRVLRVLRVPRVRSP